MSWNRYDFGFSADVLSLKHLVCQRCNNTGFSRLEHFLNRDAIGSRCVAATIQFTRNIFNEYYLHCWDSQCNRNESVKFLINCVQ